MSKKTPARLRELATELGASSRNLADVFLDKSVYFSLDTFKNLGTFALNVGRTYFSLLIQAYICILIRCLHCTPPIRIQEIAF